ncbi:hypothetical protein L208DRAFT_776520 [Tricholoma matsutake]|nr:hypothetical protein L208DRAFT_776520 [Tricholoma matsutake 945]
MRINSIIVMIAFGAVSVLARTWYSVTPVDMADVARLQVEIRQIPVELYFDTEIKKTLVRKRINGPHDDENAKYGHHHRNNNFLVQLYIAGSNGRLIPPPEVGPEPSRLYAYVPPYPSATVAS